MKKKTKGKKSNRKKTYFNIKEKLELFNETIDKLADTMFSYTKTDEKTRKNKTERKKKLKR